MPVRYQLTLEPFSHDINVFKNREEELNIHRISKNLACDLEIFFTAVANDEMNNISLEDILYPFTGLRKIPPLGLHKLIDVFSCDTSTAPKLSTCGYTEFTDKRVGVSTYICNKIWRRFWTSLTIASFT